MSPPALSPPNGSLGRRIPRSAPLVTGTLVALSLLGCSQYRPFDSEAYLREQLAQKALHPSVAVEVPFALSQEIRGELAKSYKPNPNERRRIDQVLDLIFGKLRLNYTLTPTRNAAGAWTAREGNCLSFVNLFVGLARHQRLTPFYVEVTDLQRWNYKEGMVVSRGHIVAGMYVSGELKTYDFLPYRPKAYRDFKPIDDLTATAHFYNNLGAEALLTGDLPTALAHFELTHRIAPEFVKGLNNLGVAYAREGRFGEAVATYQTGLEREPEDPALLTNLARAYQQMGRLEDAQATLAKVEGLTSSNPFFFVYQAEVALARDKPQEALRYLAEALRQDSELPEIHITLVKAYLALGQVDEARHHLERALKLDATNPEALGLAAMLGRRTSEPAP
jgi:tetratricopeptide (TPR) repeat protein